MIVDHRIKQRPATSCEDFSVISVKQEQGCDCYIDRTIYASENCKCFKLTDRFDELYCKEGYGIVIKENKEWVISVLKVVDWMHYAVRSGTGIFHLNKSDIIAAYENYCKSHCWYID